MEPDKKTSLGIHQESQGNFWAMLETPEGNWDATIKYEVLQ